jgi:hypothetical protein
MKMYEINQHEFGDLLTHYTVTPIRVIRRGCLPGCSGETIDAIDCNGRKFCGNPAEYFVSEEDAWKKIRLDLMDAIQRQKVYIAKEQARLAAWERVVAALPSNTRVSGPQPAQETL